MKKIIVLALLLVAQSCFAQETSSVIADEKPAPIPEVNAPTGPLPPGKISSPVKPEHEVEFFIETNKKIYRQGENIYIRFWIKNNGESDVRTLYKKAYVQFFTDKRGYGLQDAFDFVIDKSEYPRYVILCVPTDKEKFVGSSLKQTVVRPGFYLTGRNNVMIVFKEYWSSNVVPIEVWNEYDMNRAGAPDDGVSGEEFIKQKPQATPFILEPF